MSQMKKFFRLTSPERKLFIEATFTLIWVRIMIGVLPIRWYSRILGTPHSLSSVKENAEQKAVTYKILQALVRGRKAIPWPTRCLTDAITAKRMLQKRGLRSTLYLGVAKENEKMTAHAWLRCGNTYVTGKRGMQRFTVVSTFQ